MSVALAAFDFLTRVNFIWHSGLERFRTSHLATAIVELVLYSLLDYVRLLIEFQQEVAPSVFTGLIHSSQ